MVSFTFQSTPSSPYNVLYPGTTSTNVISLPAEQNYVAGNCDGAALASYGVATRSGGVFNSSLKGFCGILRFALKGTATITRIELNSLGGEKLRGNFTVTNFSTGAFTGGTAGTLTYNVGGVTLQSGADTYFHVAIPAQTYGSGIEALVYQTDGAFMRLLFWVTGISSKAPISSFSKARPMRRNARRTCWESPASSPKTAARPPLRLRP